MNETTTITGMSYNDLAKAYASLQAELLAHKENEGDECPLCVCEAEVEKLKGYLQETREMLVWDSDDSDYEKIIELRDIVDDLLEGR